MKRSVRSIERQENTVMKIMTVSLIMSVIIEAQMTINMGRRHACRCMHSQSVCQLKGLDGRQMWEGLMGRCIMVECALQESQGIWEVTKQNALRSQL